MTPTAIARAIPGTSLARSLFIAALALCSGSAIAQRPRPAIASWDTLYHQLRLFELRDSVNAWKGATAPTTQFYRGIVAHAFNDNDGAIAALAQLIDSMPRGFSPNHLADAADALGDSYRRVSRYRESAAIYRKVLRLGRSKVDSATHAELESWATIGDALADVPPQHVTWTAESHTTPVTNDSVTFALAASVNGDTLRAP